MYVDGVMVGQVLGNQGYSGEQRMHACVGAPPRPSAVHPPAHPPLDVKCTPLPLHPHPQTLWGTASPRRAGGA